MRKKIILWVVMVGSSLLLVSCMQKTGNGKPFTPEEFTGEKEIRGVWLRPPEDPDTIPEVLDNIRNTGFNAVFLETLYHGFTIFPGSDFPLRPEFQGKDVLKTFIRQAHQRDISVHCWTEVFYWQVDTKKYPNLPHSPVLDDHPQWLLLTREGKKSDVSENAHIFADPANPSVQAFLVEFLSDLLRRYNVDGINLDYIRYSAGSHDTGYTDFARKAFQNHSGVDPVDIDPQEDPELWLKWVEWREDRVTDMVRRLSQTINRQKPEVLLSAAVFPEYYKRRGESTIYQNWKEWVAKGYLDTLIPMAYGPSLESIKSTIIEMQDKTDNKIPVVPALAISKQKADAYGGANHPPIRDQINLTRSLGLKGHTIFCYGWILDNSKGLKAFEGVY